jgi:hypothetical protein
MSRVLFLSDPAEMHPDIDTILGELDWQHNCYVERPNPPWITQPFPMQARLEEWKRLLTELKPLKPHAVVTTPFLQAGLPTALYLLAILRRAERELENIKFILVHSAGAPINTAEILQPFPPGRCFTTELTHDAEHLARALRVAATAGPARLLLVDDRRQELLTKIATDCGLLGRTDICGFLDAHRNLANMQYQCCAALLDGKESPEGYWTGMGMARVIQGSLRYVGCDVTVYSVPTEPSELRRAARPVDAVLQVGAFTSKELADIIVR